MAINPLTREQKLLAEIVVQLGNITEAIQSAAAGEDSSALNNKIDSLQHNWLKLSSARANLQQQLAESSTLNAELQQELAKFTKVTSHLTTLMK